MKLLNRSALIVRYRAPYIKWAIGFTAGAAIDSKRLAIDTSVYLLDENLRGNDETPPLRNYFKEIFEHELAAWDKLETRWPKKRDLATFLEWFDVTGQSMVFDLGRDEIEGEEFLLR